MRPEEIYRRNKELEKAQEKLETQLQEAKDEDILKELIGIANIKNINFDNPAVTVAFLIQNQIIMAEALIRMWRGSSL